MGENGRKKMAVSSTDVAKRAGVSVATVSRVFNKNWTGPLRTASREKVLQAAQELGYTPNAIAPILTSGRSNLIAIVVSDHFSPLFMEAFHLISRLLDQQGLRTLHFTYAPTEDINALLAHIMQYRVDGVIITASALTHRLDIKSLYARVPVVFFGGYTPGMNVNAVQPDNYGGCAKVADFFGGLGLQKVAYFNCANSLYGNNQVRQSGFVDTMHQYEGTQVCIWPGDYHYAGMRRSATEFFQQGHRVDAVFCSGDVSTLAVVDAAREHGIVPGQDLGVVGFHIGGYFDLDAYRITCLQHDLQAMAGDAVTMLLEKMNTDDEATQVMTRPMVLRLGETTPACPPELQACLHARNWEEAL